MVDELMVESGGADVEVFLTLKPTGSHNGDVYRADLQALIRSPPDTEQLYNSNTVH